MHWYYLLLIIGNVLTVLVLFVHPRFRRRFLPNRSLWLAPLPSLPLFVAWDAYGKSHGWWVFHYDHLLGYTLLGVPIEEFAFFYIIPLATLCLWVLMQPTDSLKAPK